MKIRIMGQQELKKLVTHEPKQHYVLYYTNADWGPLPEVIAHAKDSYHIAADDIDRFGLKMHVAPNATQIDEALQWSRDMEDLVVACHAGISRSSATAYLVASRVMGTADALKILEPGYHEPNRLIVWIGSKLLKSNEIWYEYVEWMKKHYYRDPSQKGEWPDEEVRS